MHLHCGICGRAGNYKDGERYFPYCLWQCGWEKDHPMLLQVEKDLREAGITPVYTEQIRRDTLQKYAMVSPMAAVGAFYDVSAGQDAAAGRDTGAL